MQTLRDVTVCGEAANGLEAVEKARELKPDAVILDITMPVLDGFKATRQIRDILPTASVLLLSMHDGTKMRHVAMAVGAHGFVCKDQGVAVLLRAVESMRQKQMFFPESAETLL